MEASEFQRVLNIGLGRAIKFLDEHDAAPHRDAILHACVHNTARDRQTEGSRAQYMFEIVERTGEEAFYRDGICTALMSVSDQWDAEQLFDLARMFAQRGDARARQAIYEKFARDDTEERFTGAEALIQLEGLPGFLYVADRIGEALLANLEIGKADYLLNLVEERCGKEAVQRALSEAREENPRIAAYATDVEASRARRAKSPPGPPDLTGVSYDEVKQAMTERGSKHLSNSRLKYWGRQASEADIARAAADLLAEEDEDRLIAYLRVFWKRRFPLDPGRLLDLARHPNDRLAGAAFNALSQIADSRIRAFALDLLSDDRERGRRRSWTVDLLIDNCEPGDVERIEKLLVEAPDTEEFHSIGFSALDLLESHPEAEGVAILLKLYEHGPCSLCRRRCVARLHALDAVPSWMLEECRYDANLDLRAMVAEWVRE
jgi:hypothetical protein